MAVQDFVVKLTLDTSSFGKSMTSINRSMGVLKSEFKASDEQMKNLGDNIGRLKGKQDYLNKSLELQRAKVESLRESYEKQVKATGENSDEAQKLAIKLNNNIKYYSKLENELKQTTEALNKAEKEIKQQQSAFAKLDKALAKTGDGLQKLSGKMKTLGGAMSAKLTAPIIGGFTALTAGTKELRENMAFLETNTKRAGYQFNDIKGKVKDVNAIFGDMDSSVEGVSDLMKTGLNSEQFTQALNFCTDAAITFKDTLKFEGVADGLQETLATGQATGPFAEALDRAGISTEKLNEDLKNCSSESERTNMIMNAMAKSGLAGATEEFKKMHPEIVAQNKAMEDLKMTAAEIGEKLVPMMQPLLDTTVTLLDKIDAFATAHPDLFNNIVKGLAGLAVVGPIISGASKAVSGLAKVFTAFTATGAVGKLFTAGGFFSTTGIVAKGLTALGGVIASHPIVAAVVAAVAIIIGIIVLLWNKCEWFRNKVTGLWIWIKEHVMGIPEWIGGLWESLKSSISGFWAWLTGKVTGFTSWISSKATGFIDWVKSLWESVKYWFNAGVESIVELVKLGVQLITLPFTFIWENIKEPVLACWESLKASFNSVMVWFGEQWAKVKEVFGTIGAWFSGVWESIKGVFVSAGNWFGEKFTEAKNAVMSAWASVSEWFAGVWESIKGVFSSVGAWFGEKFTQAKEAIFSAWSSVKGWFLDVWNGIKGVFSNVGSWFSEKFTEAKNAIVNTFNSVVDKVRGVFDRVKETVRNAIDTIKGYFNFEWNLPHIKTPHFVKTGETALGIPKIDVEWYKNGGIMTKPTMFGLNGNNPMVGGEAGPEAILPLRVLFKQMRDIVRDEVGTQPINVVVNVNNEMDGKQIGKVVTYEVKKNIDRSTRNYNKNRGK